MVIQRKVADTLFICDEVGGELWRCLICNVIWFLNGWRARGGWRMKVVFQARSWTWSRERLVGLDSIMADIKTKAGSHWQGPKTPVV